jgi:hypothetical protein
MLSGFTFNRIVIVQSLEPSETETGRILSEFISGNQNLADTNLPIQVINCGYAAEFLEIVQQLTTEAAVGNVPLLHVECHGDLESGLEFENGSTLSWELVAAALLPLNVASKFNLLSVFSACFGAHFLGQMGAIEAAPCWCMIAPTETVDPGEILAGFRAFYSVLFRDRDMGSAVSAIAKCKLSRGRWLWEPAEVWFEKLITGYVEVHCNKSAARKRAKIIYRQLKEQGQQKGIGALLRILRAINRDSLLGHYFDTYFIIDQVPGNTRRFENLRQRVRTELARL